MSKTRKPTLAMRLDNAEKRVQNALDVNKTMHEQVAAHDREEGRLANEITRLGKIIEGLKEELFNKSLALANAEGKLERVSHEDAERAEVVIIQDAKLSKFEVHGTDVAGPPVPFQKAVLKYDLAQPSLHILNYEDAHTGRYIIERQEKPKHWVNRY